mgnify:FL=1
MTLHVSMYVVYYTFCIIMILYQDDKIECGLAEIIKAVHIKKEKKAVVSLLSEWKPNGTEQAAL